MSPTFQLTPDRDIWHVTFLVETLAAPLFLSHTSTGLGWTTEREDAKPFQYRHEAVEYVVKNTSIRIYREPIPNGYLEINFTTRMVAIKYGDRNPLYLPFEIAIRLYHLPLFKPKLKELAKL